MLQGEAFLRFYGNIHYSDNTMWWNCDYMSVHYDGPHLYVKDKFHPETRTHFKFLTYICLQLSHGEISCCYTGYKATEFSDLI